MSGFDLSRLELRESPDLPENTLVAPLPVIREIRAALGKVAIQLQVGVDPAVLVSSDLFQAFDEWHARCVTDDAFLN